GESLVFVVTDTGPGLPPNQLDRLFTLFTRLDNGEGFRRGGTGVGLALVRRLCTLMGGTVTAANRPEGGALFTVRLAFVPVATAAECSAPTAEPGAASVLRILVVEDNKAARELLAEALRAAGHTVETAADARTALAAYAVRPPDVVVLDLNLPDHDGLEVARRIRSLAAPAHGPRIVGCSAEAFAETRNAALAAGMDAFLEKPVRLATLAKAVAQPTSPATDDIFRRLGSTEQLTRTQQVWTAEWPELRAKLETALAAADAPTVGRHTHYLRSTALLLGDRALADAIQALADAALTGEWSVARTRFDELAVRAAR
ncbi:MAG: response regulator, partial [Verrucomicrobia bacterium]|nr:response regulator [Verrucomicrobiota bacterium]